MLTVKAEKLALLRPRHRQVGKAYESSNGQLYRLAPFEDGHHDVRCQKCQAKLATETTEMASRAMIRQSVQPQSGAWSNATSNATSPKNIFNNLPMGFSFIMMTHKMMSTITSLQTW